MEETDALRAARAIRRRVVKRVRTEREAGE